MVNALAVVGATLLARRRQAGRRPSPDAEAPAAPADPPLPLPVTREGGLLGVDTRRLAPDPTWFLAAPRLDGIDGRRGEITAAIEGKRCTRATPPSGAGIRPVTRWWAGPWPARSLW